MTGVDSTDTERFIIFFIGKLLQKSSQLQHLGL